MIKNIEKQKEEREKHVFVYGLSMDKEQAKVYLKKERALLKEINQL